MAQKSGSRPGGGGAKKPASTARSAGTTKKSTAPAKSSGAKKPAPRQSGGGQRAGAPVRTRRAPSKELQRQLCCGVMLVLGVVALISWFPAEGWLVNAYRSFFKGLVGWGYFITPITFLWAAVILWIGRERPARPRVVCALLLPVLFGAFVHIALCSRESIFAIGLGNGLKKLWEYAQDAGEHCGGVIAGALGILLCKAISRIGAFVVLVVSFVLAAIRTADITPLELWELLREQYMLMNDENDADEYEDGEPPLPAPEPVPTARRAPKGRKKQPQQPEPQQPTRRRVYDEDWEELKDHIFAAMGVDKGAALRVAAAVEEEKREKQKQRSAPAPKPKKDETRETAKPEGEERELAKPEKEKPAAPDLSAVQPLSVEEAADIAGVEIQSANMDAGASGPIAKKEKIDRDAEAAAVAGEIAAAEDDDKSEYIFPDMSLLNKSDPKKAARQDADEDDAARLEAAIRSYGVGATVTGSVHGPTVTRYELRLDQGVKLSKVTNLQNDIALSIGASNVRIAPVPDKISTVGVEVPNREKTTVWLGDVIDSDAFKNAKSKLSFAVGKDIGGNVIIGNIAKMPHVLIAGTTGSGKSVCINSLILSLLYKSTPDEVRMIMVDPKQVELGIYNGMPHLYVPVVTDAKKAAGALQWSVVEMLKRYRLFSEVGVRDLAGYNAVLTANEQPILPQVVIIIDELADLMMVAAKEVEESICRVAQMGRAAGMHLVVATQSPRADVITGLMKANIPSRIAFAVSSALESRIILDQQGADRLVGQGDMLYSPIGIGKPLRVQGAFVTDEEREEIINFVKREAEAEYSDEILAEIEKAAVKEDKKGGKGDDEDAHPANDYDELLPQAVDVIFETKQASVSMLQRRLKLGYSRAARLIDQLEEVGVVGPYEGSKPRQILLTKQQWQEMQYSQGTAPVDTIAQEFAAVSENDTFAAAPEDEDDEAVSAVSGGAPWDEDEDE